MAGRDESDLRNKKRSGLCVTAAVCHLLRRPPESAVRDTVRQVRTGKVWRGPPLPAGMWEFRDGGQAGGRGGGFGFVRA